MAGSLFLGEDLKLALSWYCKMVTYLLTQGQTGAARCQVGESQDNPRHKHTTPKLTGSKEHLFTYLTYITSAKSA